jgi:Na+-transporting NADH:ubiquinone oxidoreductase subunit D
MSTETTTEVIEKVKEPSEPLFSKKNRKLISDPLDTDNPITVQVLGICSALAVTVKLQPTVLMSLALIFVCVFSNLFISLLRNSIPSRIRIIVQLAVVSLWVTIVDQVLKAYAYDVSKQLSVFVTLIITNCIVMGRLEAFALANKPWPSILDGLGNGLGYAAIILIVAFFRELLGSGSLYNFKVFEAVGIPYVNNGLMLLSSGACIVVGLLIWAQRARNGYAEEE